MLVETTKGTFDEADLSVEVVPHDTAELFAFDRRYYACGSNEVIAIYRDVKFHKVNPFAETPEFVQTEGGLVASTTLEKTLGRVDDANEFSCWVEYRLLGKIVHRSADVKLKKVPEPTQSQAGGM
jgi:hypothetical protein